MVSKPSPAKYSGRAVRMFLRVCVIDSRHMENLLLLEKLITPEDFAQILCNDLDIPESTFIPVIASSINSQVHDYEAAAEVEIPDEDNRVAIQVCNKRKKRKETKQTQNKTTYSRVYSINTLSFFFNTDRCSKWTSISQRPF